MAAAFAAIAAATTFSHGRRSPPSARSALSAAAALRAELSCRRHGGLPAVSRSNVLPTMVSTSTVLLFGPKHVALVETTGGAFRECIDTFDGYTFLYPKSWIQVRGAGADIFFRDPFVLDENMSRLLFTGRIVNKVANAVHPSTRTEILRNLPISVSTGSVEDLGPPEKAAEKVLKQYLTQFMPTRLGVRRESNVLSASSKVADDGRLYYEVEVNIKSNASNNELAVMPQDRGTKAGVGQAVPVGPRRREQAAL